MASPRYDSYSRTASRVCLLKIKITIGLIGRQISELQRLIKGGGFVMPNNTIKLYRVLSILFVLSITACATGLEESEPLPLNSTFVLVTPDQSQPNSPFYTVVAVGEQAVEPEAQPMPGTVASVLKKIEINPFSLYWRDENSYTYFIGETIDAEYKPNDKSLRVRDIRNKDGLVCFYDENGALRNTQGRDAEMSQAKDVCSKMMFALDDDMGG